MGEGDMTGPASPWSTALDPVANMRALADVQLRSARAAAELVDRLIARVDGNAAAEGDDGNGATPGGHVAFDAAGFDQIVDVWAQLAKGLVQAVTQFAGTTPAAPVLDVAGGSAAHAVFLTAGSKSAVWLHNSTEDDVGPIRLHSTDLRDHRGGALVAATLQFTPEAVESLPARSSREVAVAANVPEGQAAGAYRGAILAEGLPAAWLPVELVVPHR